MMNYKIFIYVLFLSACAPILTLEKKNTMHLPENFLPEQKDGAIPSVAESTWKEFFKDQNLNSLIEIALKNNQELSILEQEINVANNEIMARQGEYLPKLGLAASGGIEKAERFSSENANSSTRFGKMGLVTTWELDIWRKLRNATKSAYLTYLSSVEGRRFVITNLVAEIANTYFELMALDNQLRILKTYVKVLKKIKQMAQVQQSAGKVTSLPVQRFESEVLRNKSRQIQIEQDIIVAQNKMNLLLGRFPQKIKRNSKKFLGLIFSNFKSSVPAKLLDNRPDIKKASLELEASKLNIEVAKARFYPSLSIDGGIGYESFNSKHFEGTPTSVFYGLATNLTAPLINRKAIEADYFSANNKQIQAVYNYEFILVKAYTEVVNQLNMIKNYDFIYKLKSKQVRVLNKSIQISNVLFQAARVDYIESLFTQRDALDAQLELAEIKKLQLSAYVNLYKSLGGGWKGMDEQFESVY